MLSIEQTLGEDIQVEKYSYIKNLRFLQLRDQKVVIKPKKKYNLELIYHYLDDHHVNNYLKPLQMTKEYLIFPYVEKSMLTPDEKAKKMLYNLSLWQSKTTIHEKMNVDNIKEKYESYKNRIRYLDAYYHDLQDMIETKVYMAPSEYLLIRNMTMIYHSLYQANAILDKWYEKMQTKKTQRRVYCHGQCELSHFLGHDHGYFISLEKAHLGEVSEDFSYFFHHDFKHVDMISTFDFYQHKYPFLEEERLYLYLNMILPEAIDIYPSSLKKCQELVYFFEKMKTTNEFLLEQQEYDKKHK